MNKQSFTGKTKEEAIINACESLNAKEEELVIIDKEEKKSLFNKKVEKSSVLQSVFLILRKI